MTETPFIYNLHIAKGEMMQTTSSQRLSDCYLRIADASDTGGTSCAMEQHLVPVSSIDAWVCRNVHESVGRGLVTRQLLCWAGR